MVLHDAVRDEIAGLRSVKRDARNGGALRCRWGGMEVICRVVRFDEIRVEDRLVWSDQLTHNFCKLLSAVHDAEPHTLNHDLIPARTRLRVSCYIRGRSLVS